ARIHGMAHDRVWACADNVLSALFLNLYHRGRERILADGEPNDKESNWDQHGADNFQCIGHMRKLPALGIERHEDEPANPMNTLSQNTWPFWKGPAMHSLSNPGSRHASQSVTAMPPTTNPTT